MFRFDCPRCNALGERVTFTRDRAGDDVQCASCGGWSWLPFDPAQAKASTQRRAEAPLRPAVAQQPCDLGLFSDDANQAELDL